MLASLKLTSGDEETSDNDTPKAKKEVTDQRKRMPRKSILHEKRELMNFFDEQGISLHKKIPHLNLLAQKKLPHLKDRLNKQILRELPDQVVQYKIAQLARDKRRSQVGEPDYKYKAYEDRIEEEREKEEEKERKSITASPRPIEAMPTQPEPQG